ncbi:MAG: anaerobic ribonucleoside-triphosphate reductase [Spirochaetes bacterium]|nr:anaerobic ribonucleoside-triphosphate reductase [Spirochaetota bacterium]
MLTVNYNSKLIIIDDYERQPCEVFSRVMGYLRPITLDGFKTFEWNEGKVSEFNERHFYSEQEFFKGEQTVKGELT